MGFAHFRALVQAQGGDVGVVDSFACSWPWNTFAACSRDDEPKPKEGAEPRELSGCEPNIERVPIFEAEAVLMVAEDAANYGAARNGKLRRGVARRIDERRGRAGGSSGGAGEVRPTIG